MDALPAVAAAGVPVIAQTEQVAVVFIDGIFRGRNSLGKIGFGYNPLPAKAALPKAELPEGEHFTRGQVRWLFVGIFPASDAVVYAAGTFIPAPAFYV